MRDSSCKYNDFSLFEVLKVFKWLLFFCYDIAYNYFIECGEQTNLLVSIFKMTYMKVFAFLSAVRSNQYYTTFWHPQKDQMLECFHENQTMFN